MYCAPYGLIRLCLRCCPVEPLPHAPQFELSLNMIMAPQGWGGGDLATPVAPWGGVGHFWRVAGISWRLLVLRNMNIATSHKRVQHHHCVELIQFFFWNQQVTHPPPPRHGRGGGWTKGLEGALLTHVGNMWVGNRMRPTSCPFLHVLQVNVLSTRVGETDTTDIHMATIKPDMGIRHASTWHHQSC